MKQIPESVKNEINRLKIKYGRKNPEFIVIGDKKLVKYDEKTAKSFPEYLPDVLELSNAG